MLVIELILFYYFSSFCKVVVCVVCVQMPLSQGVTKDFQGSDFVVCDELKYRKIKIKIFRVHHTRHRTLLDKLALTSSFTKLVKIKFL